MRSRIVGWVFVLLCGCSSKGEGNEDAGAVELVALPEGSRELDGIVNLVDEGAAKEVADFLGSGKNLTRSLNLFLTHYQERYDFVFLFTERDLPNASAGGRFVTINSEPRVGTGVESEYRAEGIQSDGRLKGAIAVQFGSLPFAHEVMHYWGVFLDRDFGFGIGRDFNSPAHWGYAGVSGVLGGFDPTTLACETRAVAETMDCEATATGHYRYVVGRFLPAGNVLPYAPLELYLMGLISADEAPAEIPVLEDAQYVEDSFDSETGIEVVEAAGVTIVRLSDIIARHGIVAELADSERHFSSAFVVVSATPASDEVLERIALYAAAFGDRAAHPKIDSFAAETGNRATMSTELGPRRAASDPTPEPGPSLDP